MQIDLNGISMISLIFNSLAFIFKKNPDYCGLVVLIFWVTVLLVLYIFSKIPPRSRKSSSGDRSVSEVPNSEKQLPDGINNSSKKETKITPAKGSASISRKSSSGGRSNSKVKTNKKSSSKQISSSAKKGKVESTTAQSPSTIFLETFSAPNPNSTIKQCCPRCYKIIYLNISDLRKPYICTHCKKYFYKNLCLDDNWDENEKQLIKQSYENEKLSIDKIAYLHRRFLLSVINKLSEDYGERVVFPQSGYWSKSEYAQLVEELEQGLDKYEIAVLHNRPPQRIALAITLIKRHNIPSRTGLPNPVQIISFAVGERKTRFTKEDVAQIRRLLLDDGRGEDLVANMLYCKLDALEKKVMQLVVDNQSSKVINETIPVVSRGDINLLDRYNIQAFYHMSHQINLASILEKGLLSHNRVHSYSLNYNDISDQDVNDRRSSCEPIHGLPIHDYVPLYFNPKNPMLFKRRNIQGQIIILEFTRDIIGADKVIFTDGNAASKPTRFFNSWDKLSELNWACLKNEYWSEFGDGKRTRCAEVLVYGRIPAKYIKKIYCNNIAILETVKRICEAHNIEVTVSTDFYFY